MARRGAVFSRLAGNGTRAVRQAMLRASMPRGKAWLRLRLDSPIPEQAAPSLFGKPPALSFFEVLRVLDRARRDPKIGGVVVRFRGPPGGVARAEALRRALLAVRTSGRPVVAWSERYATLDLLAASGADHVLAPESGSVFLVGLRLESFFLKELLDGLGVKVDVVRAGDFKAAGELFTRSSGSPEQREQQEALAEDLFETLVSGLAEGRGLERERLASLVDEGPFPAPRAEELGLIDGCCYPDELEARLLEWLPDVGEPGAVPAIDGEVYLRARASDPGWRPLSRDLPRVAVVVASGGIRSGRGPAGVGSDTFRELFEALRRDEGLAGVLVRIESPGGDAVASDLLWRALRRLREERPVVASFGDVAASGGYFLGAGADAIVVEPAGVTGSIGVVGGKVDLSGLYERLGIRKEAAERGARAGLLAEDRGFAPDERRALREEMAALYELFLDRVATGRGLAPEAVDRVAGGRVWSGTRAVEHGLADALGGPLEALAELRRRAGLGADEPVLIEMYPRLPRLRSVLGQFVRLPRLEGRLGRSGGQGHWP